MSHTKRLKVVTTAVRTAAVWPDGEPLIDSDLRAAGRPSVFIGDGSLAGAVAVNRRDDSVWVTLVGHGVAVPATGIAPMQFDGAALVAATGTQAGLPSVHVIGAPDANTLRVISSGYAVLPSTTLTPGTVYFLAADGTLVDTMPSLAVYVCEVLWTVPGGTLVKFFDRWAWDQQTAGEPVFTPVTIKPFIGLDGTVNAVGDDLTLTISTSTSSAEGESVATSVFPIAGGVEVEADWHASFLPFDGNARFLALALVQTNDPNTIAIPSVGYANPLLGSVGNDAIGIRFTPEPGGDPPQAIKAITDTRFDFTPTNWDANFAAVHTPRRIKMRVLNEGSDTRVSLYAPGAATPDEVVIPGYQLTGNVSVVFWSGDHNKAHVVSITSVAVGTTP